MAIDRNSEEAWKTVRYIVDKANHLRSESKTQDRLYRLDRTRHIYAGHFAWAFPNEFESEDDPKIANTIQTGLDDIANLVSESTPVFKVDIQGSKTKDEERAAIKEGILMSYWLNRDYLSSLPAQLALDMAGGGVAFMMIWKDEFSDYPTFTRLDPASCFPTLYGEVLVDLLVVTEMPLQLAKEKWPELNMTKWDEDPEVRVVELMDYWTKDHLTQILAVRKKNAYQTDPLTVQVQSPYTATEGLFVSQEKHNFGRVPIAWAKRETFDNEIRGIFDQIPNTMLTQNRIVEIMLDYADQLAYAPIVAQNVANLNVEPGPRTIYQLLEGGSMTRLAPAGSSPQLFSILEYLERQTRTGSMQPASRAGEVSQSIASAAFVSSTMGQLTSTVRSIQRNLAKLMSEANIIAQMMDRKFLNREKPLLQPVGAKKTYKPSDDIGDWFQNRVIFGAGAGLDLINRSVLLLQDLGARLISRRTARENKDYIQNPEAEESLIERETVKDAFLQNAASADIPTLMRVMAEQAKGKDLFQAVKTVQEQLEQEAQAATEQATAPTEGMVPVPEGAPPAPAQPTAAPEEQAEVNLPLPPTEQIIVAPPRF